MDAPTASWSTVSINYVHPHKFCPKISKSNHSLYDSYPLSTSYVLQPQMMAPTSAIDPSLHYVNLANQMQSLQIGNPAVSGYLSPQQWLVWPGGVPAKHSGNGNASQNASHGGNHSGYSETD